MASSSPSASSSSSTSNSPCAACKFLRRKCMPGCIFAPYFPPEEPQKFASVHKVFGASNVTKLLNDLLPHQREDAVNSLAYEAEARMKDPVYGCVGAISVLQRQIRRLQKELDVANAELLRYAISTSIPTGLPLQHTVVPSVGFGARNDIAHQHPMAAAASTSAMAGPPPPPPPIAYSLQWATASAAAGESSCNNGDPGEGGDQSSM